MVAPMGMPQVAGSTQGRQRGAPNSNDVSQMDLRSFDLSGLDLRQSLNDVMYTDFDTLT